jgi:hypothetical protein
VRMKISQKAAKVAKEPLRTEGITIETVPAGRKDGYIARIKGATGELGMLESHSTGSQHGAAWNLALRYFWGGNTNAFAGDAEREATLVTALNRWHFRASLRREGA